MSLPTLSIVIANYNYGKFLADAIESVLSQSVGDRVELLVCDGGSTDSSLDVIKKYEKDIAWWVSEKDKGQSDAFNKGFAHAKGRYLTWLNADDWFAPNALKMVLKFIDRYPECEWFAGGDCRVDVKGRILSFNRTRKFQKIRADSGDIQICAPSSFFSRALYDRSGGYVDIDFHYAMDIELWDRFYNVSGAKYRQIPGYLWIFRVHEESKTGREGAGVVRIRDESDAAWAQICKEKRILADRYSKHLLTWWRRWFSMSWREAIMSKIDTIRFCGVYWRDFFPTENDKRGVW